MIYEDRKCIKHDEDLEGLGIQFTAFKNYSRPSCLLECQAKRLYDLCGCLPYYFPDFSKVWGHPVTCGKGGLICLSNVNGKPSVERGIPLPLFFYCINYVYKIKLGRQQQRMHKSSRNSLFSIQIFLPLHILGII